MTVALAVCVLIPSVALTVIVLLPSAMSLAAMVTIAVAPGLTLAGETVHPLTGAVHVRLTMEESPLMAAVFRVMDALEPAIIFWLAGVAVIEKSGSGSAGIDHAPRPCVAATTILGPTAEKMICNMAVSGSPEPSCCHISFAPAAPPSVATNTPVSLAT